MIQICSVDIKHFEADSFELNWLLFGTILTSFCCIRFSFDFVVKQVWNVSGVTKAVLKQWLNIDQVASWCTLLWYCHIRNRRPRWLWWLPQSFVQPSNTEWCFVCVNITNIYVDSDNQSLIRYLIWIISFQNFQFSWYWSWK